MTAALTSWVKSALLEIQEYTRLAIATATDAGDDLLETFRKSMLLMLQWCSGCQYGAISRPWWKCIYERL